MNSVLPSIARPRFTLPQQLKVRGGLRYSYIHSWRPVAASNAYIAFSGRVRYMIPSTTNGVVSNFSTCLPWNNHLTRRFFTLAVVIWFRGLKRQLLYVCEYISQLPGSSAALSKRS